MNYTIAAFDQLAGGSWKYSEANKAYLKLYCSNLIGFVHTKDPSISVDGRLEDPLLLQVDFDGVSSQVRADFPMKDYEAQIRAYLQERERENSPSL